MALIYPVLADAPEPEEGSEPDVAELAADLSDQWLVEGAVGEEGDDACFGPLAARMAWDLAGDLVDKRPGGAGAGVPPFIAQPARQIIAPFQEDRRVRRPGPPSRCT